MAQPELFGDRKPRDRDSTPWVSGAFPEVFALPRAEWRSSRLTTNDMPIKGPFGTNWTPGKTAEAKLVRTILTQPHLAHDIPKCLGCWWDTLAASDAFDTINPVQAA